MNLILSFLFADSLRADPHMEAMVVLHSLDVITTVIGLRIPGIVEANPLHKGEPAKMILGKTISVGFFLMMRAVDMKKYRIFAIIVNSISAGVIINNILLIKKKL